MQCFILMHHSHFDTDSLMMGLQYDELEEKVSKLEELLKNSVKRIELLEASVNRTCEVQS